MDVWHDYVIEMKEKDLVIIIEERLKLMPPVSRFGGSGKAKRKEALIDRRLMIYFEEIQRTGIKNAGI